MIVVDFTVVANLLVIGDRIRAAQHCMLRDREWVAPSFWRVQFCDLLTEHVRSGQLDDAEHALDRLDAASWLVRASHEVLDDLGIFELAQTSNLSFAQAAHVWVARRLGASLVTADTELLLAVPDVAVSIEDFAAGR